MGAAIRGGQAQLHLGLVGDALQRGARLGVEPGELVNGRNAAGAQLFTLHHGHPGNQQQVA